ncbi:MAG: aminotransferase class III-fold pyridoxal phosphate-dependent enzyme [Dehalococcoidia bacterium]
MISERRIPAQTRSIARSTALKARAARRIPTLAQTFSKAPTQFVQGVAPVYLERGAGSHVWDVDGNEYIDYPMALGPVILGHNEPAVIEAAVARLQRGIAFSLPHPLELELTERLCHLIPCAEMARFGKNGSDATSGAVRAARAFTGRDIIACCGYHGWQDWFIGTTTRSRGVPQAVADLTKPFAYNDLASLERIFDEHPGQVAGVIMEPVGVVEPQPGFLEGVRELAHRHGALLIFDEVVTGFRLDLGGAQARYGVTPDLACFGKAMGNGFPISAVVGRAEVMAIFDEIFFSFTFGGDVLALSAALAVIGVMEDEPVIPHLWRQGAALRAGYNAIAADFGLAELTECVGLAPRTVLTFKDEQGGESLVYKSLFQQECLKRGVLFSGGQNLCYRHDDDDINRTLEVYREAMAILADAVEAGDALGRLEGPVVEPVFRRA